MCIYTTQTVSQTEYWNREWGRDVHEWDLFHRKVRGWGVRSLQGGSIWAESEVTWRRKPSAGLWETASGKGNGRRKGKGGIRGGAVDPPEGGTAGRPPRLEPSERMRRVAETNGSHRWAHGGKRSVMGQCSHYVVMTHRGPEQPPSPVRSQRSLPLGRHRPRG